MTPLALVEQLTRGQHDPATPARLAQELLADFLTDRAADRAAKARPAIAQKHPRCRRAGQRALDDLRQRDLQFVQRTAKQIRDLLGQLDAERAKQLVRHRECEVGTRALANDFDLVLRDFAS